LRIQTWPSMKMLKLWYGTTDYGEQYAQHNHTCKVMSLLLLQRVELERTALTEKGKLLMVFRNLRSCGFLACLPSPGFSPVTITGTHPARMASNNRLDVMVSPGNTKQYVEAIMRKL